MALREAGCSGQGRTAEAVEAGVWVLWVLALGNLGTLVTVRWLGSRGGEAVPSD